MRKFRAPSSGHIHGRKNLQCNIKPWHALYYARGTWHKTTYDYVLFNCMYVIARGYLNTPPPIWTRPLIDHPQPQRSEFTHKLANRFIPCACWVTTWRLVSIVTDSTIITIWSSLVALLYFKKRLEQYCLFVFEIPHWLYSSDI